MLKFIRWFLVLLILVYIIGGVIVFLKQRSFIYLPPEMHPGLSSTTLESMEELKLQTSLEDEIPAWWHPPETEESVIIYFHGNGSTVYDGRYKYQHFIAEGFGVLGMEYPGYSDATGSPSQKSLMAAAESGYEFLMDQGISSDRIIAYGRSLGAAVASQLAGQHKVDKIVLEVPFNSLKDMSAIAMPAYPYAFLVKDKFESDKALADLDVPLLIMYGTQDRVVPPSQSLKLFDSYSGPKEIFQVEGGTHNNIWISGGREKATAFLKDEAYPP